LNPLFLRFAERHPRVRLDVQFDDRYTDLVPERIDVGFRAGAMPDGRLVARKLLPIQHIICATPAYLERHGKPESIEELLQHRCTGFYMSNSGKLMPWEFQQGSAIHYREIQPVLCFNDAQAETDAVLAGAGIGQLGSYTAAPLIRSGRLKPLLTRHITESMALHVYYSHRSHLSLRARALVDFAVEHLADNHVFYLGREELASWQ
jgi:DNA-binding transcriptional LysR family regulator